MAFKGAWHRGDGGGGGGGGGSGAGDRRYSSSTDAFTSFVLPPQGLPGNQMGLAPMNYATNPNAMYSVMNQGPAMMAPAAYSSAAKSLPYTGVVSNMYRDYGVIDNEISFKFNTIAGPMPRVGDRVVCQMKPAEGFGTHTPHKYVGFDVRSLPSNDTRRPARPAAPPPMTRNSDSYMNRGGPNRNQSSQIKRPPPSSNTGIDPHHHSYVGTNRDRHGPINHTNNGIHRSSPSRRSHSRTSKVTTPKRNNSRAPPPKYSCTLPKGSLDCSELNVVQIRSRYSRLHIPSDFYHASFTWHQSIPIDRPLKFITPCSFHIFNKNVPRLQNEIVSILDPPDADYAWNVRVMLMSSPDIQTLISRACVLNENGKNSINPDDLEHPSKLIKFLVGVRYQNEYFPLGGPWSESLDGPNPDQDPQVLIRTAIRCIHAQTGIDLSKCIQWCRYLEVRYHRPEEIHKGRLIESRVENIIVFLPDVAAACMPSSLEWEEINSLYKQACAEEIAEELNEANTPDEDIQIQQNPSHHAAIDIDTLRVIDLKAELKAREQPITGLKTDLKKRLLKIIQQEKADEEKAEATAKETPAGGSDVEQQQPTAIAPTTETGTTSKIETKEHTQIDADKLRKEIELKYQFPSHRSILVHPTPTKGDKFDCRVVSLHYLLNYANKDTIKEKCFELYLFSECFFEMLTRDYSYHIYRALFSCLEVTETSIESQPNVTEQDNGEGESNPIEEETTKDEQMIISGDDVIVPGLDLNTEEQEQEGNSENGKKRKRSPSKEEITSQRKKTTSEEADETTKRKVATAGTVAVQTRQQTVHPELLLAFTFFDRNRCGYLNEKDLEELLLLSGLSLTKNEAKMLVSRVTHNERVQYRQLTDKAIPIDDSSETNHVVEIETNEMDIDALAPKGNLLLLPQQMTVFGVRSSTNDNQLSESSSVTIIDNQRAMKQLEIANKIQTGLETKIDLLKKEIHKLTEELHSSQKNNRSYSEQLSDTKKRLRDTQHDLKELEDKYKRYLDALHRVRNESRVTFDHLTHVLGIKEKSTVRKSDDEVKKTAIGTKIETKTTTNEPSATTEKSKTTEEQEQTTKVEEILPTQNNGAEQQE